MLYLYLEAKSKDEFADSRPFFAVCDAARLVLYLLQAFITVEGVHDV